MMKRLFFIPIIFVFVSQGLCQSCNRQPATGNTNLVNASSMNILADDEKPDAASIEAAISKLPSGSTLFFPAGNYMIDAPIKIDKDGLTLKGEEKTVFYFTNAKDYYAMYQKRIGMINICSDNITITGIAFDQNFRGSGKKDGDNASIGCILIGCSYTGTPLHTRNLTISGCTFDDYYGDAISVSYGGTDSVNISGNIFTSAFIRENWQDAGTGGEQAISVASGNNICILNNKIYGALDDAIAIHRDALHVTIQHNEITTTGGRIYISGVNHGMISDNTVQYVQDGATAIYLTFEERGNFLEKNINRDIQVINNQIIIDKDVKISAAIRLNGPGNNITVKNNKLKAADKMPTGIQLNEQVYQKNNQVLFGDSIFITNNTIENFNTGIKLQTMNKINDAQTLVKNPNATVNSPEKQKLKFSNRLVHLDIADNYFENCDVKYSSTYGDMPAVSKRSKKQFE